MNQIETVPLPPLPSVPGVQEIRYAGFWMRVAAGILDSIIVSAAMGVCTAFASMVGIYLPNNNTLVTAVAVLFTGAYSVFLESSSRQATVGMMAFGMRVTDYQYQRISLEKAIVRFLSEYVSTAVVIGFIMIAFTKRKQGLHDIIAETLVVVG